jgi:hypothetical protein
MNNIIISCEKRKNPSLLCKWLPREKSIKFGWLAKYIAMEYYPEWINLTTNNIKTGLTLILKDLNDTIVFSSINNSKGFFDKNSVVPAVAVNIGDTRELGKLIYTKYLYAFEIASIILLAAIIAAVALTLRRRKDIKYFDPGAAVRVKRQDRVRIVSMASEPVDRGTTEAAEKS